MTVKLLTGRGIAGLVDYVTRDKPRPDDPKPTTAARVGHAESLGLPGADPDVMIRCMQGLTADQRSIKQQAGVTTRGRRLREPYGHLMLSCPENQQPTAEEFRAAARGALAKIGISERHYGVLTIHQDTKHRHAHVVFSRIDPATGLAATLKHSHLELSKWAREWEREHGGIVIRSREPGHRAKEGRKKSRDATGRLCDRTPDDRREWSELLRRKHDRRERTELNRTQTRRRLEAECQRVDRTEAAAPRRLPLGTVEPERERPRRDAARTPFPIPDPNPDPSLVVKPERERPRRDAGRTPFPTPDPNPDPSLVVEPERERPRRDAARTPFPIPDPNPDPSLVVKPERERPRRDAGRTPFPTPDPHPDPSLVVRDEPARQQPGRPEPTVCPVPTWPDNADESHPDRGAGEDVGGTSLAREPPRPGRARP